MGRDPAANPALADRIKSEASSKQTFNQITLRERPLISLQTFFMCMCVSLKCYELSVCVQFSFWVPMLYLTAQRQHAYAAVRQGRSWTNPEWKSIKHTFTVNLCISIKRDQFSWDLMADGMMKLMKLRRLVEIGWWRCMHSYNMNELGQRRPYF